MLTRCRNILRVAQQLLKPSNLFSFSHYQPPSIDELTLNDFQESCLKGMLVDKSKFISEIQNYKQGLLITRPRRWGKTMSLQMLKAFYGYTENISVQKFNKSLFFGGDVSYDNEQYQLSPLEISKNEKFCAQYCGKYPIIHIKLKGLKERKNSIQEVREMLYESISEAYSQHIHLFNRILLDQMSKFSQEQKQSIDYNNLHTKEYSELYDNWQKYANPNSSHTPWIQLANQFLTPLTNEINSIDLKKTISKLSTILTKYYQKPKCMLLIDEYDMPFNNLLTGSLKSGNYEALNFLQDSLNSMFDYGVKDNEKIHKTIVVGILPLASVETSDAWNFFVPFTVETGHLNDQFGFTQDEVDKEIQNLSQITDDQKSQLKEKIGDYYNGYTIGGTRLYNPFSVTNCLLTVRSGQYQNCLQPFWYTSGSLLFLENLFERLNRTQLKKLANNKMVHHKSINQILTWSAIVNNTSSLVPALWHLGYLTYEDKNWLRVPNVEVTMAMKNAIYPYFLKSIRESYPKIWSELDGSLAYTSEYFECIQTLALPEFNKQYEVDRKDISESSFRGLLSAYALATNHRIIRLDEKTKENKRIDIVYLPYDGNGNNLIIHELKVNQVARNKSEANEETLEDGFWQILCNLYPIDRLREHGTIAQQLIIRVLLFAKIKTDLKEEYEFEGSGYNFKTAEAKVMMKLFEDYDENKRRTMVKGTPEVKVNERKAAREEFLEHCKVKSLYELLEKYQELDDKYQEQQS